MCSHLIPYVNKNAVLQVDFHLKHKEILWHRGR